MNKSLRALFVLCLCLISFVSQADTKIFPLTNTQPEEILQTLRTLYGDKVRADVIQQRLVVVGSSAEIAEISKLLGQLDRSPQALRLTLREQPPAEHTNDSITYGTDHDGLSIDTVAGALVTLEYAQIAQQPTSNGWSISVDNVPTEFSSIMLQVQPQSDRTAQVLVSYSKEQNQRRRVFGNTVVGKFGSWLPLLPQRDLPADDAHSVTYSTGPKPGTQLYLRIDPVKGPQNRGH